MTPRISICIPAYRQVEFLRETLVSVREQTFQSYEVVITDDSPNGEVEELVGSYLSDSRWRYRRNTVPLGSPENWNEAIRLSSAPLVKLLHHDDKFAGPEALGRFVAMMDDNPAAHFGFASCVVIDVRTGRTSINRPSAAQVGALCRSPATIFAANIVGAPSVTIYRRSVGLDYDAAMTWLVDVDFYYRIIRRHPEVVFSIQPLILTVKNAEHQVTEQVRADPLVDIGEHLRLFEKLDPAEKQLPAIATAWRRLFYRYDIHSEAQLADRYSFSVSTAGYLQALLGGSFRNRTRVALGRLVYRTYMLLPPSAQAQVRAARGLLTRVKARAQ